MNDIAHNEVQNESSKILECLTLILGMGVSCSVEFPRERMTMSDVIIELPSIQQKLLWTNVHKQWLQVIGKFFLSRLVL